MRLHRTVDRMVVALALAAGLGWSTAAFADEHIRGIITGRGEGGTLIVQSDSERVVVVMSDVTKVQRMDGMRAVRVSSSDLVPGLRIRASGEYETPDKLVATKVTFTKADFKMASAIQGGVTPTDQRSLLNEQNIKQHGQVLTAHGQELSAHSDQLAAQGSRIATSEQNIVATTGAVAATNARISNLDDYTAVKSITVYFANGKAAVSKDGKTQLQQLAAEVKGTNAYLIQVQAYASAVGPEPLNQKLSMQRADAVSSILQQSGVALTSMVVPAAMGTSEQVASNSTAKGQQQNRRVVITVLQNKGIAAK